MHRFVFDNRRRVRTDSEIDWIRFCGGLGRLLPDVPDVVVTMGIAAMDLPSVIQAVCTSATYETLPHCGGGYFRRLEVG